jgi:threonine synthase
VSQAGGVSAVTALRCSRCEAEHHPGELYGTCGCGSPLLVDYDLDRVAAAVGPRTIAARPPGMWRYRELLPTSDATRVVTLGEGSTPLLPVAGVGRDAGLPGLRVKDEGVGPTGTFKARGAACGITMARELGAGHVALPTAGNAGGAWAAYGAAAGVPVHVAMPADALIANRTEVQVCGAELELVDGVISEAGRLVAEWCRQPGWFDAATLCEPYRLEGKKTLLFEIAEQLATPAGAWQLPDAIVYPAGGGVGIIGIWRALGQLVELGWVVGPPPRLIVVQAAGCAPLVRAFEAGAAESQAWPEPATLAAGLQVPKALGDVLVLRAVRETGGTAVAVTDEEIVAATRDLAAGAGILAAPEGAATLAGARRLRARGELGAEDRVVLINTGTGLKYPEVLDRAAGG